AAWNVGANGAPAPAVGTVQERALHVWLTPPGFIKAAQANHATVTAQGPNKVVTFTTPDKLKVTGVLSPQNLLLKVSSAIDNPVLGDMPVDVGFADYKAFGDVMFPTRIVERQGGFLVLDLAVATVKPNGASPIDVPPAIKNAFSPAAPAASEKLAE